MTNLITTTMAVWTLFQTNTVTQFPTRDVPDLNPTPEMAQGYALGVLRYKTVPVDNPTEKTEVTTVTKTTHYRFDCCGEVKQFSEDEVVTNWSRIFTLKSEWAPATNATSATLTNITLTNITGISISSTMTNIIFSWPTNREAVTNIAREYFDQRIWK